MAQYGPHIDAVLSKGHNLLVRGAGCSAGAGGWRRFGCRGAGDKSYAHYPQGVELDESHTGRPAHNSARELPLPPPPMCPQINLYAMYKVPIEAAVALGLQAWKSLLAAVKALSEDKKAVNKSDAVKPHAA